MHHKLAKKSYPVPEAMIRFVNGVLRKLSKSSSLASAEASAQTLYGHTLLSTTSVSDNIAPWLLQKWEDDWGGSRAKLICEEMMPSDFMKVNTHIDVTTKHSISSIVGGIADEESQLSLQRLKTCFGDDCILLQHGSLRIGSSLSGDVTQWPGYNEGHWWVQDASSTLPALVLTQTLSKTHNGDMKSLHIIDMCSAPGGKASQLASAGFGRVTAIEASERRSKRLLENLNRLNLSDICQVIIAQGQDYLPTEGDRVDGILLDVPCSATGTGARRPDVLRRSSDLSELLNIQEALANHCADNILRPGGVLVYATCSILKVRS